MPEFMADIDLLGAGINFGPAAGADTSVERYRLGSIGLLSSGPFSSCIFEQNTDTASTAVTTEQDLIASQSTAFPAGMSNALNDAWEWRFFGTFGANARTKRIQFYWAGTVVADTGVMAFTGAATDAWEVRIFTTRESSVLSRSFAVWSIAGTSTAVLSPKYTRFASATNLSLAQTIRLTATVGASAAASDVVLRAAKGFFYPGKA